MDVAAFRPSKPLKRLPESREPLLQFGIALREAYHHANPAHLLRARRERPGRRRSANERDEVAPFHCPMPSRASLPKALQLQQPSTRSPALDHLGKYR
jgi:hypothetical protein